MKQNAFTPLPEPERVLSSPQQHQNHHRTRLFPTTCAGPSTNAADWTESWVLPGRAPRLVPGKSNFPAFAGLLVAAAILSPCPARAGGVTIMTHGLNGTADDWISWMASALPAYPSFPGTNFSIYRMAVTNGSGNF